MFCSHVNLFMLHLHLCLRCICLRLPFVSGILVSIYSFLHGVSGCLIVLFLSVSFADRRILVVTSAFRLILLKFTVRGSSSLLTLWAAAEVYAPFTEQKKRKEKEGVRAESISGRIFVHGSVRLFRCFLRLLLSPRLGCFG